MPKKAAAKRQPAAKKAAAKRPAKKAAAKRAAKKPAAKRATKPRKPAAKRGPARRPAEPAVSGPPVVMEPPRSGIKVRMYRQGHGDCFLLAFRQENGDPFYMLIDCGMKKGSKLVREIREVAENIRDATGGHLHLVAITHEHEDHVSGFRSEKAVFGALTIDKLWLAWTEDPENDFANGLRKKYKDTLLGLVSAADRLQGARDPFDRRVKDTVEALLEFELSDEERGFAAAEPAKIKGITNKEGILIVKKRAEQGQGTEYLRPHMEPRTLPNVDGVRFFVLGPPEHEAKLKDMDPKGEEEFHFAATEERAFLAAVAGAAGTAAEQEAYQPFEPRHRIPSSAAAGHPEHGEFFETRYGLAKEYPEDDDRGWRKIDADWLRGAEQFALRMNNYINNTSLVLAIELPRSKKVLLFVGDAQRGNWVSWAEKGWTAANGLAGDEEVTVSDLLGRTVFYKVGHHGSHNATMNKGGLREMAQGKFADQFVAMIPANEKWALALKPDPWIHPLPAIYHALLEKAKGRVLVMDREPEAPSPQVLSAAKWQQFLDNSVRNDLFYEFTVED
jgi:beta-lactamase superfamily II metal-dependent hydrolase